jgi:hypothetical protein
MMNTSFIQVSKMTNEVKPQMPIETSYSREAYDKYYKRACEVCVPIVLKVPVYVSPIVIEKEPLCVEKNGY